MNTATTNYPKWRRAITLFYLGSALLSYVMGNTTTTTSITQPTQIEQSSHIEPPSPNEPLRIAPLVIIGHIALSLAAAVVVFQRRKIAYPLLFGELALHLFSSSEMLGFVNDFSTAPGDTIQMMMTLSYAMGTFAILPLLLSALLFMASGFVIRILSIRYVKRAIGQGEFT